MNHFDLRIYLVHGVFWLAFAAGHIAARYRFRRTIGTSTPSVDETRGPLRAPRGKILIAVHTVAFALLYTGVERAVFRAGMPNVRTSRHF